MPETQVITDFNRFRRAHSGCVATIGKFDGVHIGHQLIVRQLKACAADLQVPAVVIVIEPHPEEFFAASPRQCPARLSEAAEKIDLLTELGVDYVYLLHFDEALSQLSAEAYIEDILVAGLGIRGFIVGSDFRFGHQRRGDYALLQDYAKTHGFSVIETASCEQDGQRVSSTLVRDCLAAGDFERVKELLGRPYCITGTVVQGRQLGRELGFPTCNLKLNRQNIPLHGVYACIAHVHRRGEQGQALRLPGAANIGYRPSVSDDDEAVLEVHLLDVSVDLYEATIAVEFVHRIREERKFDSLSALSKQIALDVQQTREYFANHQELQATGADSLTHE